MTGYFRYPSKKLQTTFNAGMKIHQDLMNEALHKITQDREKKSEKKTRASSKNEADSAPGAAHAQWVGFDYEIDA